MLGYPNIIIVFHNHPYLFDQNLSNPDPYPIAQVIYLDPDLSVSRNDMRQSA